ANGGSERLARQHVRAVELAIDHSVEQSLPVGLRLERHNESFVLEEALHIGDRQRSHVAKLDEAELEVRLLDARLRLDQRSPERRHQQRGRERCGKAAGTSEGDPHVRSSLVGSRTDLAHLNSPVHLSVQRKAAAAPPRSAMNSRRLMSDMGIPPSGRSLPRTDTPVLGTDLKCSESRRAFLALSRARSVQEPQITTWRPGPNPSAPTAVARGRDVLGTPSDRFGPRNQRSVASDFIVLDGLSRPDNRGIKHLLVGDLARKLVSLADQTVHRGTFDALWFFPQLLKDL